MGHPPEKHVFNAPVSVSLCEDVYECVCGCLSLPTAVCRELRDRTQCAEGPLGAAVRQSRGVAVNKAQTDLMSHSNDKHARDQEDSYS